MGQPFVLELWIIAERRGEEDVCVTLIDEVNTAGVSGDKDNDSVCEAGGGLKSPETFTGDVFLCVWSDFCVGKKKKEKDLGRGKQELEDVFFLAACWKRAASKSSCILSSRQG